MLRKVSGKLLYFFTLLYCFSATYAQKSAYDNFFTYFKQAQELYAKEKYVAAQELFQKAADRAENFQIVEKEKANYYIILCSIELFHENTEQLADKFLVNHPESPYLNTVAFRTALFDFEKKKYKPALQYFSKVNKEELSDEENAEYYFKTGYSWFMLDSLDKARKAFYEIKDIDTRYTPAANYYYAHIAYTQKNYETAIAGFNKLSDDEVFGPLVPYYISQCYYFQGKYDQLLSYAPALIDSVVETRQPEMAKMIGDAYYRKEMFKEAVPYYERYFKTGKDFKPEDYFQAGFSYFELDEISLAIPMLEKASIGKSAMSQHANYILGDCYIVKKEKDRAQMAFAAASEMDFSPQIKEDALFNYAVLSYELSNSPFNSSIKALNEYIKLYPDSRRSEEAYRYLLTACMNTKNYQEAISYLEKIKTKDKNIKKAYQRAAFFRGLELFNNLQFNEAKNLFETSLRNSDIDPFIAARTYYWLGETHYRNGNIDEALENYLLFSASRDAVNTPEFNQIDYNIAYCRFNQKHYAPAAEGFNTFLTKQKNKKTKMVADAYNRLGDCSFTAMRYKEAIDLYDKAIEIGLSEIDYSMFQKAFALGLTGDHRKKVSILDELISKYPESPYCDDATYESGRAYMALQQPEQAAKAFNRLNNDYPSSSFVKKSILQLGLIDYNAGKNTAAIEKYKKVVSQYPNTNEARSALMGIKNIYVEMNDVDSYLAYAEGLGSIANVSIAEKDSLMYYAAEGPYTLGDCKKALQNFNKYLETYPKGNFVINAWFYKADCHRKSQEMAEAFDAYNQVISRPTNDFTELALVAASRINMDKKEYYAALENFNYLDSVAEINENIIYSRLGIMMAYYNLSQYTDAIEASQRLQKTTGISQEVERTAIYVQSKSLLAINDHQQAIEILKKLAHDVKNAEGSEAKFLLAKTYYEQKQSAKAEKEIFSFVDMNSPHQYWVAKAFILLAQIYYDKKDIFQASSTLQSVIANYNVKDDGIIDEAKTLKDKVDGKTTRIENNKNSERNKTEEDY